MRKLAVLAALCLLQAATSVLVAQSAPDDPKAVVEAFFAAHSRGDLKAMESMYTPAATVSLTAPGPGGAPTVMTMPVKQYVGWYQGQFASRTSMNFVVGQVVVHSQPGFATTWIPLEVHEVMKDGSKTTVRAVASLQMFVEGGAWKITAHGWQAARK